MTPTRHIALAAAALALTGLAAARPAAAQTNITAISFLASTLQQNTTQFSLGYSFTTTNALSVTALGYLNDGQTGANAIHQVQIYQITGGDVLNPTVGTALAGPTSVTTTLASPTFNTFSYTTLTAPISLLANTAYEIVANNNGVDFTTNAQGVFFGGGISYGSSTYQQNQTTSVFNTNTFAQNNIGNFGPNFMANTPAAAPEPSQIAVLGFAVLGLAGLILKARRKTALTA